MKKAILALLTLLVIAVYGTFHFYGKVSGLEVSVKDANSQVRIEKAKADTLREEYNALQKLYDAGDRNKAKSKEATDEAKRLHRSNGTVTRASDYDARLLSERSSEVRARASGSTVNIN